MPDQSTFQSLLSYPNRLIGATLLLLIALAWLLLFSGGPAFVLLHHTHHGVAGVPAAMWDLRNFAILLLVWLLMAVAMMLPTAAPAILCFADISRAGQANGTAGRVTWFVLGYLSAWSGFGALAASAQVGLATAVFNPARPLLGGMVLIGAGLYQFSALKAACLTQCRSPMAFFLAHWRDGARGGVYLGLRHGIYCIGCCWVLMALMLFAGAMSIAWTVGLTGLMLTEKIARTGRTVAQLAGLVLIVCGGGCLVCPFLRGQIP